jgi:hypothetical protein
MQASDKSAAKETHMTRTREMVDMDADNDNHAFEKQLRFRMRDVLLGLPADCHSCFFIIFSVAR